MPSLIIEDNAGRRGGTFEWPLLIGSCPANAVMIADNNIAHVHAWIGSCDRGYFVGTVASGGKVSVNGKGLEGRRLLSEGDLIQIGRLVKMTFKTAEALPKGVRPVAFPWRAPSAGKPGEQETIECGCGATIHMDPPLPPRPPGSPERRAVPRTPPANAARPPAPTAPAPLPAPSLSLGERQAPAPLTTFRPTAPAPARPVAPAARAEPPALAPLSRPPATPRPVMENRPAPAPAPAAPPVRLPPPKPMPVPVPAPAPAIQYLPMVPPPSTMVESLPLPEARIDPPAKPRKLTPAPPPSPAVDESLADANTILAKPRELPKPPPKPPEPALEFLPDEPPKATEPKTKQTLAMCGICQSAIATDEPMKLCAECGLTFHADCWAENRGCASYGCSQVGALEPPEEATPIKHLDPAELVEPFPWEFLLLGGSVVAAVAGALAFGLPSALLGIVTIWTAVRRHLRRWPMLVASCALCFIGLVVGLEFSKFWWLNLKPFEWIAR